LRYLGDAPFVPAAVKRCLEESLHKFAGQSRLDEPRT
jgi:hypothetical protein